MQGAGHSGNSVNQEARDAFAAHVKGMREIPVEELNATFSLDDMIALETYQRNITSMGQLALKPLPTDFETKYKGQAHMLVDNTTTYDDEGEDLLFEDPTIINIVKARSSSSSEEMTALFRVRRSVVAFILHNWKNYRREGQARSRKLMAFEDYKQKESVVIVYTGESKGKTSAGLGLMIRALGNRWNVCFIQFIKHWGVGEHVFIRDILPLYKDQLSFYKGGKGFYKAGDLSEGHVSDEQHVQAAKETYDIAFESVSSGKYDLVICDEINNALHDGLITEEQFENLFTKRHKNTSMCFTGRDFPEKYLEYVDIATNMTKIKHHFDDKFLANKGIDF